MAASRDDRARPARDRPDAAQATTDALAFCFDDVSSLRFVGATPLVELRRAATPVASPSVVAPAQRRSRRSRAIVVGVALVVFVAAAVASAVLSGVAL